LIVVVGGTVSGISAAVAEKTGTVEVAVGHVGKDVAEDVEEKIVVGAATTFAETAEVVDLDGEPGVVTVGAVLAGPGEATAPPAEDSSAS